MKRDQGGLSISAPGQTVTNVAGKHHRSKILLIVYLLLFVTVISFLSCQSDAFLTFLSDQSSTTKITLHIGMNDRNSYEQELSAEQAQQIIAMTCLKHVSGFTLYPSYGQYLDSSGKLTQENGFIVEFYGADRTAVTRIMDELLLKLNQESILYEENTVNFKFYSRKVAAS